jgi:hypothetical protein
MREGEITSPRRHTENVKFRDLKGKNDICPFVMLRYEASSSPCIAIMLVEEDPSYLRMTVFLNHAMGNLFQRPTRKVGYLLSM